MKSQKKIWVQDTFEVQTVQKKMWPKKISSPKKISGQKTFWVQQNFVSKTILGPTNLGFQMILGPKKCSVWLSQQYSSPLVSITVANGSIEQHIGTILVWLCLVQLTAIAYWNCAWQKANTTRSPNISPYCWLSCK